MRVQAKSGEEWTSYVYYTTYRMGWFDVLSIIKALFPHLDKPEILVSEVAGSDFKAAENITEADLFNIPEAGAVRIRGANKIYDRVPFQFSVFNQTNAVTMDVPTSYLNTLKKNETEYLNEEEKLHTFDLFMDSVELNAVAINTDRQAAERIDSAVKNAVNALINALLFKENFTEDRVVRTNGLEIDLTKICNQIVENCKEALCDRIIKKWEEAPTIAKSDDSKHTDKK